MITESQENIDQPYLLYADDDADDQAFVIEMMRRINPSIKILCFFDGRELFSFLQKLPADTLLPSCIVLDLNMPVWDGKVTLKALKNSPAYESIPVYIFSTSSSERDIEFAETLGAMAYITKPYGQKELFVVCQEFAECCDLEPRHKEVAIQDEHR